MMFSRATTCLLVASLATVTALDVPQTVASFLRGADNSNAQCCVNCDNTVHDKYFSIDTAHGFCGECCMEPAHFGIFKVFEPGLQKATTNTPCKDNGWDKYTQTVTHGVFPITMTLDLYAKPSANATSADTRPVVLAATPEEPPAAGVEAIAQSTLEAFERLVVGAVGGSECNAPGACGVTYQGCCFGAKVSKDACKCHLVGNGSGEVGTHCSGTDKAGACGVAYTACCAGYKLKGDPCTCDVSDQ